jgi:hypothetical protein
MVSGAMEALWRDQLGEQLECRVGPAGRKRSRGGAMRWAS